MRSRRSSSRSAATSRRPTSPRRRTRRRTGGGLENALAWLLLAFAIFNLYMTIGSLRLNTAVFAVFIVLEATEIVLAIGFWNLASGGSPYILHVGSWLGIVDTGLAWYTDTRGPPLRVAGPPARASILTRR